MHEGDPGVEVVPFEPEHAEGVATVTRGEGWPSFSAAAAVVRAFTAAGSQARVAIVDGQVVGVAQAFGDGAVQSYLALLVVLPEYRGRGIGRRLAAAAFAATGTQRMDVVTDSAEAFYAGFPHRRLAGFRLYPDAGAAGDPVAAGGPTPGPVGGPVRTAAASGSPYEAAVGFSRAIRVGDLVAVSGTAPIWPDGHVEPEPLTQARRCWEIALGALAELGGRVDDVVRTRQYLIDRSVAAAVSVAHAEVFDAVRPASTMVVVAGLLDPRWVVEVELDAAVTSRPS